MAFSNVTIRDLCGKSFWRNAALGYLQELQSDALFEMQTILPPRNGVSETERLLAEFLSSIKATGGDESIPSMVRAGTQQFRGTSIVDRQIFVLMGDCAPFNEGESLSQATELLNQWIEQSSDRRRFLAIYAGSQESFKQVFRELADSQPFGRMATDAASLIDEVVDLARPVHL